MKSLLLYDGRGRHGSEKIWAVILDSGDGANRFLLAFAREQGQSAARLTAIGAFRDAVLGYFDWERKAYRRIPVEEQVEVVSFLGDVALTPQGEAMLHAHVVLARADGTTLGGHLIEGHVRPTLEVMVSESPPHLRRLIDRESGLALIDIQAWQ